MSHNNVINNPFLHRVAVGLAAVSLVITTSIALLYAPPASADPSLEARRVAQRSMARKPAKKAPAKKAPAKKAPAKKTVEGVVNINTATESELAKLPGIGPTKAERIVEYRKKRGPFRRVRDLRRVKGIGRMTIKRLGRHLAIKGVTTLK